MAGRTADKAQPRSSAAQRSPQTPVLPHGVQEGNRWVGNPPTGEEVARWFRENVRLHHDDLKHEHYLGGLVLIPNTEKVKRVNENGAIFEQARLIHTPYVKVETRVAYWWDWIRAAFDDKDVIGKIEPVHVRKAPDALPPGFFYYLPQDQAGKPVPHIGCSMQAKVIERSVRSGNEGRVLFEAPPATKLIATLRNYVDPFATMKAETGAIGRALGMAGMLVIPGSGVATAEDMQEIGTAQGQSVDEPQVPQAGDGQEVANGQDVRERIAELSAKLEAEAPERFAAFVEWAKSRNVPLNNLKEHHVRGVLRQVERHLAEHEA